MLEASLISMASSRQHGLLWRVASVVTTRPLWRLFTLRCMALFSCKRLTENRSVYLSAVHLRCRTMWRTSCKVRWKTCTFMLIIDQSFSACLRLKSRKRDNDTCFVLIFRREERRDLWLLQKSMEVCKAPLPSQDTRWWRIICLLLFRFLTYFFDCDNHCLFFCVLEQCAEETCDTDPCDCVESHGKSVCLSIISCSYMCNFTLTTNMWQSNNLTALLHFFGLCFLEMFEEVYKSGYTIGQGAFGRVFAATRKSDGEKVAAVYHFNNHLTYVPRVSW